MIKLCEMKMIPGGEEIPVTTLEYCVDSPCPTPESYLCADGGEHVVIRVNSYSDGFIAANINQEWKWFPLSKCAP